MGEIDAMNSEDRYNESLIPYIFKVCLFYINIFWYLNECYSRKIIYLVNYDLKLDTYDILTARTKQREFKIYSRNALIITWIMCKCVYKELI